MLLRCVRAPSQLLETIRRRYSPLCRRASVHQTCEWSVSLEAHTRVYFFADPGHFSLVNVHNYSYLPAVDVKWLFIYVASPSAEQEKERCYCPSANTQCAHSIIDMSCKRLFNTPVKHKRTAKQLNTRNNAGNTLKTLWTTDSECHAATSKLISVLDRFGSSKL